MILFRPSLSLGAKWLYYGMNSDSSKFYYDAESITYPANNIVRVQDKTIYSESARKSLEQYTGAKGHDISQGGGLNEFNCHTREHRIIAATFYNSSGEIVPNNSDTGTDWMVIPPETVIEHLYKAVCKKKKP